MGKTAARLPEHLEGMLCYLLGWVTGLLFLLIERENAFVRFHAFQSLLASLVLLTASSMARLLPVVGGVVSLMVGLVGLATGLLLMAKAYQGERFKLPILGAFVEDQLKR